MTEFLDLLQRFKENQNLEKKKKHNSTFILEFTVCIDGIQLFYNGKANQPEICYNLWII
jgi:hypothetical protein